MINIILASVIIVFIIDLSGAVDKLNKFVGNIFFKNVQYSNWSIPLLGCSLCCTFHFGGIYLLCTGSFSILNLMLVCLIALFTSETKDILILIKDLINKIINKIYEKINEGRL